MIVRANAVASRHSTLIDVAWSSHTEHLHHTSLVNKNLLVGPCIACHFQLTVHIVFF